MNAERLTRRQKVQFLKSFGRGSNPLPPNCEADALTTRPSQQYLTTNAYQEFDDGLSILVQLPSKHLPESDQLLAGLSLAPATPLAAVHGGRHDPTHHPLGRGRRCTPFMAQGGGLGTPGGAVRTPRGGVLGVAREGGGDRGVGHTGFQVAARGALH